MNIGKMMELASDRKKAYQLTFSESNVAAQAVLKDLSIFCGAFKSNFHVDPHQHALYEGRREVYLRIVQHLKLTPDQLIKILGV